jgi:hypothetical protein
LKPPFDFPKKV